MKSGPTGFYHNNQDSKVHPQDAQLIASAGVFAEHTGQTFSLDSSVSSGPAAASVASSVASSTASSVASSTASSVESADHAFAASSSSAFFKYPLSSWSKLTA